MFEIKVFKSIHILVKHVSLSYRTVTFRKCLNELFKLSVIPILTYPSVVYTYWIEIRRFMREYYEHVRWTRGDLKFIFKGFWNKYCRLSPFVLNHQFIIRKSMLKKNMAFLFFCISIVHEVLGMAPVYWSRRACRDIFDVIIFFFITFLDIANI